MVSELVEQWEKIDGQIITKTGRAKEIVDFLKELNLLGCVAWHDDNPNILDVSLLENEGKLAGSVNNVDITAVADFEELVKSLNEKFFADVEFDYSEYYTESGEEHEGIIEELIDVTPVKNDQVTSVVITRTPAGVFPYLANMQDVKLGLVELGNDRRAVLQSTDCDVDVSDTEEAPFIAFYNNDDEYYFLYMPTEDYEDSIFFVWGYNIELICGSAENPDPTIYDVVKKTLSPYKIATEIAAISEDIDVDRVNKALSSDGKEGSALLMAEFGASHSIGKFLANEIELHDVDKVVIYEPRGYMNAMGRSFASAVKEEKSGFWHKYRQLSFEKPWLLNIYALGIGVVGAMLFTKSLRKEKPTVKNALTGVFGILLVLEGVAEYMLNKYVAISEESDRRKNNDW